MTPPGLINPIVNKPNGGYNADPDIIFNKNTDELWMYYIQSRRNNDLTSFSLNLTKSKDGINWSKSITLFNYNPVNLVSPTVVCHDSIYIMWSVNDGKDGWTSQMNNLHMRKSYDGIEWSQPEYCILYQPNYIIWHIDVIYVQIFKEYWMLFAAYPKGDFFQTRKMVLLR